MKTALVFPGQGSQSVGMLADSAAAFPVVRETFAEASDLLGYDLWALCQDGPADRLNRTEVTQPAVLTASIALWRAWGIEGGPRPDVLAGHSLGEYSALVAAGVIRFCDAVRLVRLRGELMQTAVPEGTGSMAAILGLTEVQVMAACADAAQGEVVSAVNFNAPGQVVIAGTVAAVERAIAACKASGAKRALPLAVSVPSHCELMRPAAEALQAALSDVTFEPAAIPVVQNVTAGPSTDPATLRAQLVTQLYLPVRWVESVQAIAAMGVGRVVECGPGKVLSGLVKRIVDGVEVAAIERPDDLRRVAAGNTE